MSKHENAHKRGQSVGANDRRSESSWAGIISNSIFGSSYSPRGSNEERGAYKNGYDQGRYPNRKR